MRIIVDAKGQRIIGQTQPQLKKQPHRRKTQTSPPPADATTTTTTTTTTTNNTNSISIPPPISPPANPSQPTFQGCTAPQPTPVISTEKAIVEKKMEKEKELDREKEKEKEQETETSRGGIRKKAKKEFSLDEGYNSADESTGRGKATSPENEKAFEEDLRKIGLVIVRMRGDGNCLFRAIAHQVYGDPEMHDEVRKRCIDYMEKERDHYSQFVSEDFDEYIVRKKKDKCYGNNMEIQAITEIFNRPIEVYAYGHSDPINIFHNSYQTDNSPMRLSYHHGNHYNSVIDPKNPSVGVGLGLPGLKPGLADQMQLEKAMAESVEETLVAEFKKDSDWEMTQSEIEEAILRQSEQEYWNSLIEQQMLGESFES